MKRSLLAAAAALLISTGTATAAEVRSGYWSVYDTRGDAKNPPLCGMYTRYSDAVASIMVKYILGNDHLSIHVFKHGWRFPQKPVTFPITLGFDQTTYGSTTAFGSNDSDAGPMVEFTIKNEATDDFLRAFASASWMWIRFDEGSEKPWPAKMYGSRNAAALFMRCVTGMLNAPQPYGNAPQANGSTQPYGRKAQPTQPFGNGAAQPQAKPAAKRDDGAI
jgi:hypothetical protein